jgi:hypothetical protein
LHCNLIGREAAGSLSGVKRMEKFRKEKIKEGTTIAHLAIVEHTQTGCCCYVISRLHSWHPPSSLFFAQVKFDKTSVKLFEMQE